MNEQTTKQKVKKVLTKLSLTVVRRALSILRGSEERREKKREALRKSIRTSVCNWQKRF